MPVAQPRLTRRLVAPGLVAAAAAIAGCTGLVAPGRAPVEADFVALQRGMTHEQVLARVGRPNWIFGVRQENLSIWNYRYDRSSCLIYQVSVRPNGTVRDVGTSPDPACDGPRGRD